MQHTCEGCIARDKQYKVLQTELQFQIKKLNEDMAHQKVKLEIAHQKQAKKWAERLAFTKNQRQIENKSWMEKYDAMTQLYDEKLKKTETQCKQEIAKVHQQMAVTQLCTVQQSEAKIIKEVTQIKEESEDYKRKLLQSKEEQKKYLIKIHQEELIKLHERHKEQVATLEEEKKELQHVISGFENIESNHNLVVVEITDELLEKKLEITELKEKIKALEHRIKYFFEFEMVAKDKQIAKLKADHQKACNKLVKEFSVEKEQLIKEFNEKVEDMLEKEYVKCIEYEKKLKAIDEQRQREIQLYVKQIQSMRNVAEEKLIPKSQFHEEISTLKGRLTSKEKDIERAKEQIKQCKLQIENNEQILTKFFKVSNTHTHTAPDIFVNTPKKKDYKIKKNRVSVSGAGFLDVGVCRTSNITSMECLDKNSKDFESFRIL